VRPEAWLHRRAIPDPAAPLFTASDGFDLYIDGCRGLPDNTTITRVEYVLQSSSRTPIGAHGVGGACDCLPSCACFEPSYGQHRVEVRERAPLHPSATLLLVVKTLDRYSTRGEPGAPEAGGTVGYAVLNIFCDARSAPPAQPAHPSVQDLVLNAGAWQLPLHKFPPPMAEPLSAASLDNVPAVPCATILLRLHRCADAFAYSQSTEPLGHASSSTSVAQHPLSQIYLSVTLGSAPKSEDGLRTLTAADYEPEDLEQLGLAIPAPLYADGAYDSTRVATVTSEQAATLHNYRVGHGEGVAAAAKISAGGDADKGVTSGADTQNRSGAAAFHPKEGLVREPRPRLTVSVWIVPAARAFVQRSSTAGTSTVKRLTGEIMRDTAGS
jgi:hypothetical protein